MRHLHEQYEMAINDVVDLLKKMQNRGVYFNGERFLYTGDWGATQDILCGEIIEKVRKLKQKVINEKSQTDLKPVPVEVINFKWNGTDDNYTTDQYKFKTTRKIPEEKFTLIKEAIEAIINNNHNKPI